MEKSRGRIETRTLTTTTILIDDRYLDWPGARQLIRLERETKINGKTRNTLTYAVTSLPREKANAAELLKYAAVAGRSRTSAFTFWTRHWPKMPAASGQATLH